MKLPWSLRRKKQGWERKEGHVVKGVSAKGSRRKGERPLTGVFEGRKLRKKDNRVQQ